MVKTRTFLINEDKIKTLKKEIGITQISVRSFLKDVGLSASESNVKRIIQTLGKKEKKIVTYKVFNKRLNKLDSLMRMKGKKRINAQDIEDIDYFLNE